MAKSDHSDRTRQERIERLRVRLAGLASQSPDQIALQLPGILKGILDLLEDEL